MINFKEEILAALKDQHFTPEDVDFVRGTSVTDRFVYEDIDRLLEDADFEYDNWDNAVDIDPTLVIVMKDRSYFVRDTQGDREFFTYRRAPLKPSINGIICLAPHLPIKRNMMIKTYEEKMKEMKKEIERLKSIDYTFMNEK